MHSTEEFISQYETHSDEQLYHIHANIDGYSPEAQEALAVVIKKKGGLNQLIQRIKDKQRLEAAAQLVAIETRQMAEKGIDIEFIKTVVTSANLPAEKLNEIIEDAYALATYDKEDRKIKPRTIIGSILAIIVGTLVLAFIGYH